MSPRFSAASLEFARQTTALSSRNRSTTGSAHSPVGGLTPREPNRFACVSFAVATNSGTSEPRCAVLKVHGQRPRNHGKRPCALRVPLQTHRPAAAMHDLFIRRDRIGRTGVPARQRRPSLVFKSETLLNRRAIRCGLCQHRHPGKDQQRSKATHMLSRKTRPSYPTPKRTAGKVPANLSVASRTFAPAKSSCRIED